MHKDVAFIALAGLACVTIVVHSIVNAWVKARTLRSAERGQAAPPVDLLERLNRIELALEAVSLETERNGEAQRYLVKLLAERGVEQRSG